MKVKCCVIQSIIGVVTILMLLNKQIDSAIVPPPWSDPEKNPCASMPGGWQLLYWGPLKKCFKIFQIGYPCPETMELSPAAGSTKMLMKYGVTAECKCPPSTAQSAKNHRCYKLFERGPCEKGQYFNPMQDVPGKRLTTRWGTCKTPRDCPDGMIFWPRDTKCYTLYARGPCSKGKLLVKDEFGIAKCECKNNGDLKEYFYKIEETCHEHFTKGPCPGLGNIFLPGGQCGCNSKLPHYYPETGQCYETGTIGPCPPGHIFTIPDSEESTTPKRATCLCKENYVQWTDGICYRLYTQGPCDNNEFLINSTSCVKNFCGKGRLYFPEEKTCYRIGSQGPCSLHQVVIFDFTSRPSIDGISYNGMCGCSGVILNLDQQCTNAEVDPKQNTCESSPGMIELNGQCFKLYTRGPCGPSQWLEPWKENNLDSKNMTSKAKCQCRPGYERHDNESGSISCYAPSVGIARYLNSRNYKRSYKFQFRRLT